MCCKVTRYGKRNLYRFDKHTQSKVMFYRCPPKAKERNRGQGVRETRVNQYQFAVFVHCKMPCRAIILGLKTQFTITRQTYRQHFRAPQIPRTINKTTRAAPRIIEISFILGIPCCPLSDGGIGRSKCK